MIISIACSGAGHCSTISRVQILFSLHCTNIEIFHEDSFQHFHKLANCFVFKTFITIIIIFVLWWLFHCSFKSLHHRSLKLPLCCVHCNITACSQLARTSASCLMDVVAWPVVVVVVVVAVVVVIVILQRVHSWLELQPRVSWMLLLGLWLLLLLGLLLLLLMLLQMTVIDPCSMLVLMQPHVVYHFPRLKQTKGAT